MVVSRRSSTMRKVGIARKAAARNAGAPGSENMIDITDENLATTASVLGGMVGLLCGGAGLGVALFAGTAYFAREEDSDVSNVINGVARKGLETVNFARYIDGKYYITNSIGTAASEALKNVSDVQAFDEVGNSIQKFDKEMGIQTALGSTLTSASDMAAQSVTIARNWNSQNNLAEQIGKKIGEAFESSAWWTLMVGLAAIDIIAGPVFPAVF